MSRDVANRFRQALQDPGDRPAVLRADLELATSTLEAVDAALQADLVEARRQLAALQVQHDILIADFVALVADAPRPESEPPAPAAPGDLPRGPDDGPPRKAGRTSADVP